MRDSLPNASYIGFTGTPVELTDKNTRAVFGDYIDVYDVPSMHTMYIDKPMNGHNLMQAIAGVNSVFKDKQGGLVVDYIGIAENLRKVNISVWQSLI